MEKKWLQLFLIFSLAWFGSYGQPIEVKARLDSTRLLIGAQTTITLEAIKPRGKSVVFPFLKDTITRAIEVLQVSSLDSTVLEDDKMLMSKALTITSFDSGYHVMPPFEFFTENKNGGVDTLRSNTLALEVSLVPVDTAEAIKPIKAPEEIPFTFREAIPYILVAILVLALALGLYFYQKNRKKPEQKATVPTVQEPAHRIALRALDELKEKKLWQSGQVKNYHARITDILRAYVEQRYQIAAVEKTSAEIIHAFRLSGLDQKVPFEEFERILRLSDAVKFAKGQPSVAENMKSLEMAYDFVKKTIPEAVEN